MQFEVVAGPRVLVEDDDYRDYVDSSGNCRKNFWEAHPVVSLAHQFPEQVRLYLRQTGEVPRQDHAFCTTGPGPCITERAHIETETSPVLIERNTRVGYQRQRSRFDRLVRSGDVVLWDPRADDAARVIKYLSRSGMEERLEKDRQLDAAPVSWREA
jgi:hypothetical protein